MNPTATAAGAVPAAKSVRVTNETCAEAACTNTHSSAAVPTQRRTMVLINAEPIAGIPGSVNVSLATESYLCHVDHMSRRRAETDRDNDPPIGQWIGTDLHRVYFLML